MFGFLSSSPQPANTAKVVDGELILSFPQAIRPVLWRMELGQAKASALEVQSAGDDTFPLVLKTPRGYVHDIAIFETKAKAVSALLAVTNALENAQGQINPSIAAARKLPVPVTSIHTTPAPASSGRKWIGAGALAAVLAGLIIYMGTLGSDSMSGIGQQMSEIGPAASESASETGIPLSADDFLRTR